MLEPPVTLLVADELSLIREALAKLCDSFPGCSVIAQCGDGASALQMIDALEPVIAILDLNLGEVYTLEVLRRLRECNAPTRAVVLSTRRDRKTALECIRGGAAGFVLKSGPSEHLEVAIRQILAGSVYVTPLVDLDRPGIESGDEQDPLETLSAREYQVFSLLIDGIRAKEIAARLDLSPKTVDTYRSSLMRKLDIHDVAGLVKFAIQRELTTTH